jgi:hypothetical protein
MNDVSFKTTSDIVDAVIDGLQEFAGLPINGFDKNIVCEQRSDDPDIHRFRGVAGNRVPWEVELDFTQFNTGTIDNLRSALREQIRTQKGSDKSIERTYN